MKQARSLQKNSFWIDACLLIGVTLIFGVLPALKWMNLFPLVEFRSKVYFDLPVDWLLRNWMLQGENIWSSSFYFDSWVGRLCESNIRCLNTFPLIVNLISVVVLYFATLIAFRRRFIAIFVCAVWLSSVPYLETLAWQALSLDKIATLSVILGTALGLLFRKAEYSFQNMVFANLLLFMCVVVGYNAKPSAWVLVPGLWLMPLIGEGIKCLKWSQYLILPTIYGLMQNTYVFNKVANDEYYNEHTSGGSPKINIDKYIGYLFGERFPNTMSKLIFVLVLVLLIVGLMLKLKIARLGLWALLMVLGGFAISARTIYGSAFYMLVSQVFFAWALCASVLILSTLLRRAVKSMFQIEYIIFFILAIIFAQAVRDTSQYYEIGIQQSDNFRESLNGISKAVDQYRKERLIFLIDDSMDYKYVDGGPFGRFISPTFSIAEDNISYMVTSDFDEGLADQNALYVQYDEEMRIINIFVISD
jgi:hypothetical protein